MGKGLCTFPFSGLKWLKQHLCWLNTVFKPWHPKWRPSPTSAAATPWRSPPAFGDGSHPWAILFYILGSISKNRWTMHQALLRGAEVFLDVLGSLILHSYILETQLIPFKTLAAARFWGQGTVRLLSTDDSKNVRTPQHSLELRLVLESGKSMVPRNAWCFNLCFDGIRRRSHHSQLHV